MWQQQLKQCHKNLGVIGVNSECVEFTVCVSVCTEREISLILDCSIATIVGIYHIYNI